MYQDALANHMHCDFQSSYEVVRRLTLPENWKILISLVVLFGEMTPLHTDK